MFEQSEYDPFQPPRFLRNGHVQSIAASLGLRRYFLHQRATNVVGCAREIIVDCGNGVQLHGQYSTQPKTSRKLLVLLHGWEGSAQSTYMLSAATHHFELGYDVLRLHLRDHGPSHHLNEGLFHSCLLQEVVTAIESIAKRFQPESMCLAGFSLGGNFALRVAASDISQSVPLHAVAAISPVLVPKKTMHVLENGWRLYHDYFQLKWRRSLRKKAEHFPHLYNYRQMKKVRGLRQMTQAFITTYAEFDDIDSYLAGYAITGNRLASITVPSLLIAAKDDPIIPADDLAHLAITAALKIVTTDHGGHCGFIDSIAGPSWADRTMAAFFSASEAK